MDGGIVLLFALGAFVPAVLTSVVFGVAVKRYDPLSILAKR